MTQAGYTHIAVLGDRSGSMHAIKTDTEGGYKHFLEEQQAQPGQATLELFQFDGYYEQVHGPIPIADAKPWELLPRGNTALLDAMGKSITQTGEWLKSLPEDLRPETVLFVIITDGLENASREWTKDSVLALVKQQTDDYGWVFNYLGANQDAIAVGTSLGIQRGNTMSYSGAKTSHAYAAVSSNTSRVRSAGPSGQSASGYTDEEREESL